MIFWPTAKKSTSASSKLKFQVKVPPLAEASTPLPVTLKASASLACSAASTATSVLAWSMLSNAEVTEERSARSKSEKVTVPESTSLESTSTVPSVT